MGHFVGVDVWRIFQRATRGGRDCSLAVDELRAALEVVLPVPAAALDQCG